MNNQQYTSGQRWISDNEPGLGLGTLLGSEGRTLTLIFPASGERRTYARDNAPLTRVRFTPGDLVYGEDGQAFRVSEVLEHQGLLTYLGKQKDGSAVRIPEIELNHFIQLSHPHERLLTGQFDQNHWFELRYQTRDIRQRLAQSELTGLGGARTELLPHQLYIAHEVGRRFAPRVLLADEVGLGKTVESCLILSHQLLTGRASRALILVPPTLLHQWLVELLRRFNLRFSLFDEARCQAVSASDREMNPFLTEQLVLCSIDLLTGDSNRLEQALDGEWDMMVVDEAHHLVWSEALASREYLAVEALAERTPGVLLLTATPEQLGSSGHFARLRLLDRDRFHSLAEYQAEQKRYRPLAEAISRLLDRGGMTAAEASALAGRLKEELALPLLDQVRENPLDSEAHQRARQQLIDMLLDRHGTGRVLFRNSRGRIKGFTDRELHPHPLPFPEEYLPYMQQDEVAPERLLYPERLYPQSAARPWWRFDPRVDWLINTLIRLNGSKLLLICASNVTAVELELALRTREGISSALFHEDMSIVERDRAAAWFADPEQGCKLMICSEIGSEGRNFQFAHHLALFDLPADPDLLEQRIGRLDRIGQRHRVQIHLPYFEEGAQAVLVRWYHQGLNAFLKTCNTGQQLLTQLRPALQQALEEGGEEAESLELLISSTKQLEQRLRTELEQGRDRLLELNSCREHEANRLRQAIIEEERSNPIEAYMERLFAAFGVETEPQSPTSLILRPSNHMSVDSFPGLPADGITATFQRKTALTHEEQQFLTWEHPMVQAAMELVTDEVLGSCSLSLVSAAELESGSLLLELVYLLECPAPRELQAGRFLPPTPLRLLIDQRMRELGVTLTHAWLNGHCQPIEKQTAMRIVTSLKGIILGMLAQGEELVEPRRAEMIAQASALVEQHFGEEILRLEALRRVNPNVRREEIDQLEMDVTELVSHLKASHIRLDALRLLVTA